MSTEVLPPRENTPADRGESSTGHTEHGKARSLEHTCGRQSITIVYKQTSDRHHRAIRRNLPSTRDCVRTNAGTTTSPPVSKMPHELRPRRTRKSDSPWGRDVAGSAPQAILSQCPAAKSRINRIQPTVRSSPNFAHHLARIQKRREPSQPSATDPQCAMKLP